jgi:hypothetical protein
VNSGSFPVLAGESEHANPTIVVHLLEPLARMIKKVMNFRAPVGDVVQEDEAPWTQRTS